jgi:hypothetical protein
MHQTENKVNETYTSDSDEDLDTEDKVAAIG